MSWLTQGLEAIGIKIAGPEALLGNVREQVRADKVAKQQEASLLAEARQAPIRAAAESNRFSMLKRLRSRQLARGGGGLASTVLTSGLGGGGSAPFGSVAGMKTLLGQ